MRFYRDNLFSWIGILLVMVVCASFACAQNAGGTKLRIVVLKTRDMPFYNPTVQGFTNELKTKGYGNKEGVEIKVVALSGKESDDIKLIQNQLNEKPALVVTLGTDATRLVASQKPSMPVLFSMILDPVSLGVVKSMDEPGGNFTGTTLLVSPGKQLDTLQQTVPQAKRIGLLYTEKDATSLAFLTEAEQEAKRLKLEIHSVAVPAQAAAGSSPTGQALAQLKDKVDALWLIPDPASTGTQALKETLEYAKSAHLPVLGASSGTVKSGALLALSANLDDLGRSTAEMAAHLLDKTETTAQMRVRGPRRTMLSINLGMARLMSWTIPKAVLHLADEVVESDAEDK